MRLAALENATLWKMTYPVRRIADRFPLALRRALRGCAKLLWWSANGRLLSKLRARQETVHSAANGSTLCALSYPDWSTRFDTPDSVALARIADSPDRQPALLIVIRFDDASIAYAPRRLPR